MLAETDDTPKGLRDRAILLLGFAGAFQRSELASLRVEDLEVLEGGLRVVLRRSKTDQEGEGQAVYVSRRTELCPVDAVLDWLEAGGVESGPVFRRIVKGGRVLDVCALRLLLGSPRKTLDRARDQA